MATQLPKNKRSKVSVQELLKATTDRKLGRAIITYDLVDMVHKERNSAQAGVENTKHPNIFLYETQP